MTLEHSEVKLLLEALDQLDKKLAFLTEVLGDTQDAIVDQLIGIENTIREMALGGIK